MAARIELELPDDAVLVDPEHAKEEWLNEAVIVVKRITIRSWVQIPPGAELFLSSLSIVSCVASIQVPHGDATLLVFL